MRTIIIVNGVEIVITNRTEAYHQRANTYYMNLYGGDELGI